jgi:hypothetical protein
VQPASPIPTPTRARRSWRKFWARPHRAVNIDHTTSAAAMMPTRLEEKRSAYRAIGMPRTV